MCSDLVSKNGITAKLVLHRNLITRDNSAVKWATGGVLATTMIEINMFNAKYFANREHIFISLYGM